MSKSMQLVHVYVASMSMLIMVKCMDMGIDMVMDTGMDIDTDMDKHTEF